MTTTISLDDVHGIAAEVFSAMIDDGRALLEPHPGPAPALAGGEQTVAWVDLFGDWSGRVALLAAAAVADDVVRAMLGMDEGATVTEDDKVDAFGELANVVGGNLKSLLPTQGTLGLPCVADQLPATPGAELEHHLPLTWRERPFSIQVWSAPAP